MAIFENSSPKDQVSNQGSDPFPQPLREAQEIQQVSRHSVEEVAEQYSQSSSTFLAAALGGALGSAGGLALGNLPGGFLGLIIGAAAGVLSFRGRNSWRLEKATQKAKGALDFVREQLNSLPSDAPQEVRDQLYKKYTELMNEYARVARRSIDDKGCR